MTYAQKAQEIKSKYSKRFNDDESKMDSISKRSLEAELNLLFRKQEDMKQREGIESGNTQYATGGEIQTKLVEAYNKKGKELSPDEIKAIAGGDYPKWKEYVSGLSGAKDLQGSNEVGKNFESLSFGPKFAALKPIEAETVATTKEYTVKPEGEFAPDTSIQYGVNKDYVPYKTSPLTDIASTAIASLPLGNKFRAKPLSFDRVGTNLVDYDPERRQVSREVDQDKIDALTAIRGAGGNRGQQLANIDKIISNLASKENAALADSYMREANTNAQIATQADARNADISARQALQNYQDARYVDEANKGLDYRMAENMADLPIRLRQNKINDMFLNTRAQYGYDKNGNLVPKVVPLPKSETKPIEIDKPLDLPSTTTQPRATLSDTFGVVNTPNPNTDIPQEILDDEIFNSTKGYFKNGGKMPKKKKYKCGGKLKLRK